MLQEVEKKIDTSRPSNSEGLTSLQSEVYLEHSLNEHTSLLNIGFCWNVKGHLNVQVATEAIRRTINHHSLLQCQLTINEGKVSHVFRPDSAPLLISHNVPGLSQASIDAEIEKIEKKPFKLFDHNLYEFHLFTPNTNNRTIIAKFHHIIGDAWGIQRLENDIISEYNSLTSGKARPITNGPSYFEFSKEQNNYLASEKFTKDVDFWRTELQKAEGRIFPPIISGPPRALPNLRTKESIPWSNNAELSAWCASEKTTVFQYLVTILVIQASCLFGKPQIVLGIPILNRKAKYRESQGLFANILPVVFSCNERDSFADTLKNVKKVLRASFRHQQPPFGEITRRWQADGNQGLPFDIKLSYEVYDKPDVFLGTTTNRKVISQHYQNHPLSIYIRHWQWKDELEIDFDYLPEAFEAFQGIEPFKALFRTLSQNLWEHADQPIKDIQLLDANQQCQLAATYTTEAHATKNCTIKNREKADNLVAVFEQQADKNPGNIALSYNQQNLTYQELNERSNRIAHHLINTGLKSEELVGIKAYRSFELIIGIFGILKAGGAYVPIDPSYPAERINYITNDAACRFMLMGSTVENNQSNAQAIYIEEVAQSTANNKNPCINISSKSLAYVLYTSGSTGEPKGVMLEHGGIINRISWQQKSYPIGENDCLIQKTPYAFDVSVWELFWWCFTGAKLHLTENGEERSPSALLTAIETHQVSAIHFVPSMLSAFLDHIESNKDLASSLRSINYVICSGEALTKTQVERFYSITVENTLNAKLINLYGPTEASIDVSYFDCTLDDLEKYASIPIGKPVDNTYLQIRNKSGQLLPAGFTGELYIGGCQLARCYRNKPELTEKAFIENPQSPGERLYRTGDLARRLKDGNFEYLGRIDQQIKIRGNRVELGEIEARLRQHKEIREAVVLMSATTSSQTLCAYYVASEAIEHQALRRFLTDSLPEYMVPHFIVHLSHLPVTPNGKLDRKALPTPQRTALSNQNTYVQPRTEIEESLVAVFEDVLQISPVGIEDNYFSLGGDSLKVLKIKAQCQLKGFDFELVDLFDYPTINKLSTHITPYEIESASQKHVSPFSLLETLENHPYNHDFSDVFPATELQLGMIYHSLKNPESAIYHDIFRYSFDLPWDRDAWEKACEEIIHRHEALRLSFDIAHPEMPLQRVHRHVRAPIKIQACENLSNDAIESLVANYVENRQRHQYQWLEAPLFEIGIFVVDQGVELVFSFHHVILDGWSVATIISDLLQSYLYLLGNDIPALDAPPLTRFADFVKLERCAAEDKTHQEFWKNYLIDINFSAFQSWHPYLPQHSDNENKQFYAQFSDEIQSKLEQFSHQYEYSIKHILLAMHCLTEQLMSGQEEITTGIISNGRPDTVDSDRAAGLFLNTIPLRFNNQGTRWIDAISQVIAEDKKTYIYRRYPLAEMQHALGDHKLFDIAFNFVDFQVLSKALTFPGVSLNNWQPIEVTNFSLLANFGRNPLSNRLFVKLDYNALKICEEQIRLYVRYGSKILERILSNPHKNITFQSLADKELVKPVINTKNNHSLIDLFNKAVKQYPTQAAVNKNDRTISYQELDEKSNQWAHHLRKQGVKRGDRVCLFLSRTPELITSLLAILKTGAAYVPLDRSYPVERLCMILEDSSPRLILTDEDNLATCNSLRNAFSDNTPALCWERERISINKQLTSPVPVSISSNDNAYILFTSGSTGRPKGVAMPHRALVNLTEWQLTDMPLSQGTRTLQYSPIGFDVSFQEIFSTLCGGGELVLIDEQLRSDLLALVRMIDKYAIERLYMPYIALQHLTEVAIEIQCIPKRLQYIITAGEQLKITPHIRQFTTELNQCRLDNHYGPTEAHVVTRYSLRNCPSTWPSLPPIGKPINNTNVVVLTPDGVPSPLGVTGELFITGQCLANEYFGRPELTDEKFIHIFGDGKNTRYYRTGDTGLIMADGNIIYLGRADTQVKVRGYRVELAEIEIQLLNYNEKSGVKSDCIRSAAVIAKQDYAGNTKLIAFLEVNAREELCLIKVKNHLHNSLPEYMVPTQLHIIDNMPETPSGKVNSKALANITIKLEDKKRILQHPDSPTEREILGIWSNVLDKNEICINDNFFDLGGHSLIAIRMIALIEKQFEISTPLALFIESPTVRSFSKKLDQLMKTNSEFNPCVNFSNAPLSPPLFMIHPIGGNVVCYAGLARSLKDNANLIALQAPGVYGDLEPLQSIEALAKYYAEAISEHYPSGPLYIGGWSFGGFVAFELQQEFERRGRPVTQTFLLDSIMLRKREGVEVSNNQLLNWFMWELLAGDWQKGHAVNEIDFSQMSHEEAYTLIWQRAVDQGILPATSDATQIQKMYGVFHANWRALLAYQPKPTSNALCLFSASEKLPQVLLDPHNVVESAHNDPLNGWGLLSKEITKIGVPGDHLSMMTVPNIDWIGNDIIKHITSSTNS